MNFLEQKAALEAKYDLKEVLGTGAFSEVKKAVNRETGDEFAIKIIDRSKCVGKENMIQSEINILKKVQHENVIQLFELFETEDKIYLVMELYAPLIRTQGAPITTIYRVTGGELFDSIVARGHYTEADAARIVAKILQAVDYLHELGIAHRDLKPENLLFYDDKPGSKIMLSDFGLSKIFNDEEMMKTACGTPGYVAPEVLKRQGYGHHVDLWSLGVIAYILLCGYPPFYDENNQELFQQIMRGAYEFDSPHWDDISLEAKDFIRKLLVVDPKKRYDSKAALKHAFLIKYCPDIVLQPKKEPEQIEQVSSKEITESLKKKASNGPTAPPRNLAHRVSQNLRARGMSGSRRRSADAKGHRYIPTHAPPVPKPRTQKAASPNAIIEQPEEEQISNTPLADHKKEPDSGIVHGSQSVSNSKDQDLNKQEPEYATEKEFLRQLSTVNYLIDNGNMSMAYTLLQQVDCPHPLRKLYEDMIFNSPKRVLDKVPENAVHSAENELPEIEDIEKSTFMKQLEQLVMKTGTESSLIFPNDDGSEPRTLKPVPGQPANSLDTVIAKSDASSEKHGVLQTVIGALLEKPELSIYSKTSSADSEATSTTPQTPRISVLSFNINIKPPGIKSNNTSDNKDARLDYFCEHILPKYDIISLQDMFAFGSRRRDKLLRVANSLGFRSWVCSPGKVNFTSGAEEDNRPLAIDGGLVILSKYSIVRSARMTFEKGVHGDRLIGRGALYAGIMVPGAFGYQFIHVFNTSLQGLWGSQDLAEYDSSDSASKCRRHQALALRSFMEKHLNKELTSYEVTSSGVYLHEVVLLTGTFNVNSRSKTSDNSVHGEEYALLKKIIERAPKTDSPSRHREFRLNDLLFDAYGEHPVTFGRTGEASLTSKKFQAVDANTDFIFQVAVEPNVGGLKTRCPAKYMDIKPASAQVEQFPTHIKPIATSSIADNNRRDSSAQSFVSVGSPPRSPGTTTFKPDNSLAVGATLESLKAYNRETTGSPEVLDSLTSLESSISQASEASAKKQSIQEVIESKVEAMVAFFQPLDTKPSAKISSGLTDVTKIQKKTQQQQCYLSDHFGISVAVQLVSRSFAESD